MLRGAHNSSECTYVNSYSISPDNYAADIMIKIYIIISI